MQTSERYRLMEAYRNETAGRLGLGAQVRGVCLSNHHTRLSGKRRRRPGSGRMPAPTHAVVRANDGDAYDKKPVVDEQQARVGRPR